MRGKAQCPYKPHGTCRITPAYAGKSFIMDCRLQAGQDHPRLCGEKSDRSATCFFKSGSPPPMRGKAQRAFHGIVTIRITPAYAGKRTVSTCPRLADTGSPPPMRGKAQTPPQTHTILRITPAYAGKSHSLFHSTEVEQDHPRLCGEKVTECSMRYGITGSPPPMRGKGHRGEALAVPFVDHPRLCGEKIAEPPVYLIVTGSPPPMRGKVVRAIPDILRKRITPAYAGKSQIVVNLICGKQDHPRLCGEKARQSVPSWGVTGSPPPMRGKAASYILNFVLL